MICNGCQRENRPDARFCTRCGAPLARACAACGRELPPDASFCDGCGRPAGQPAANAPAAPSPRAYTPRHLTEKILTSKSALEGERKQVTVLFADIKGSMDLAEGLDPEEWHKVLNRFFAIMASGVHRFEGTINQFTGDGVMALFGAPIAHEDHAQRACYAALQLTGDLRGFTQELKRQTGVNLSVRMGLNSGEVVVGKIGDDLRMDYTAQGHTVGLAARMEQLAEPGKAYLSEHTQPLVAGYFDLDDLGEFSVKGAAEPVRVYELKGVGALRTRLDVSRARGFSRFVGRREEMAALESALAQALEGKGQVVGVVGEAGVGKSRLCAEFVEACRARGYTINAAHCVAHGKTVPFLPVLELFRDYLGIDGREDEKTTREKIAGKLLLLDEAFRESLPLVFDFLGVADPARPAPGMDPEAREKRLFAMIKRIMQAESEREPGAILVEDLHWIDGGSEAFLEALLETVPATRTLLLLNFRPDYHAPWMQRTYYRQIPLRPFGRDEVAEMARDLLGSDPSLEGVPGRIMARTGGNPFFIEEVIQSLAESGILEGERGAYRLAGSLEDAALPANVQAILGARIDRLAEREKHVLQTASVIGKEFPLPLLQRVVDLPEQDLAAALHALTAAEFIYEKAIYPVSEFAFKHPLTQEVAYRSQLSEKRARVHEAIARAIEDLQGENLEEQAALMAHHWGEAGNALTAALWHVRAADWAATRNLREADRHWHAVLDRLSSLPESAETADLRIMASAKILGVAWRVGIGDEEARRIFEEAEGLAERTGNLAGVSALKNSYGTVCGLMGRLEEYKRLSREGLEAARQANDELLEFGVSLDVVYSSLEIGELAFAVRVSDAALAEDRRDLGLQGKALWGVDSYILGLGFRGAVLQELGRLEESRTALEKALRLSRESGAQDAAGITIGWMSQLADLSGDFEAATEHAMQWIAIAEEVGAPLDLTVSYTLLAVSRLRSGDPAAGRDAAEHALEIARASGGVVLFRPFAVAALAECLVGLGEKPEAVARAEEAVSMARSMGAKRSECQALVTLARVLLSAEGVAAADRVRETLDSGIALAEACGYRAREAYMHAERANLAALVGDREGRKRALEAARRLWDEMGATRNIARVTEALRTL